MPQSFTNIAKPRYKGLPSMLVNQKELIKLEFMVRECIATSNFISTLSTLSESTLNNLRAARDNREKTFRLLAAESDPRARDQFLQQLLNSTLEDTAIYVGHKQKCSCDLPTLAREISAPTDKSGSHTQGRISEACPSQFGSLPTDES